MTSLSRLEMQITKFKNILGLKLYKKIKEHKIYFRMIYNLLDFDKKIFQK